MEAEKNYHPGTQSFAAGLLGPKGDVGFQMVADQEKAHQIIKTLIEEGRKVDYAEMGLDGDWEVNSCAVYEDGKYKDYDSYGSSQWAPPILIIHFKDGASEMYPVWTRVDRKKKDTDGN
jgi:hypothetical protein